MPTGFLNSCDVISNNLVYMGHRLENNSSNPKIVDIGQLHQTLYLGVGVMGARMSFMNAGRAWDGGEWPR